MSTGSVGSRQSLIGSHRGGTTQKTEQTTSTKGTQSTGQTTETTKSTETKGTTTKQPTESFSKVGEDKAKLESSKSDVSVSQESKSQRAPRKQRPKLQKQKPILDLKGQEGVRQLTSKPGFQETPIQSNDGKNFQVDGKPYLLGERLGGGAMGNVFDLKNIGHKGQGLVVKTGEGVDDEIKIHKQVGEHPNIAKYVGSTQVAGGKDLITKQVKMEQGLVMEKLGGGDLQKAMGDLRKMYDGNKINHSEYWGTMQFLLKGTLEGLKHMENQSIVHQDLNPANIMLDDKTMQPKIVDFGLSHKTDVKGQGGTPAYSAPEMLGGKATTKSDVFAVGQMAYEAGKGKTFTNSEQPINNPWALQARIYEYGQNPNNKALTTQQGHYETAFNKFVNETLAPTTGKRPEARQALQHEFLKDPLLSDEQAQAVLKKMLQSRTLGGMEVQGSGIGQSTSQISQGVGKKPPKTKKVVQEMVKDNIEDKRERKDFQKGHSNLMKEIRKKVPKQN